MGRVRKDQRRESQKRKKGKEDQRRGNQTEADQIKEEKIRRKKVQVRKRVGQSQNTVFFRWVVSLEGRKVGSLKGAGAEPSDQMRDEKLHALVARSTLSSQNAQNTPALDHFGSRDVEKVHAPVARSTCPNQK